MKIITKRVWILSIISLFTDKPVKDASAQLLTVLYNTLHDELARD